MLYTEAFPEVASQIPQVPDFAAELAFARAVRLFATESEAMREEVTGINVVSGQNQYTYTVAATDMVTHKIHSMVYTEANNSYKLHPATHKFSVTQLGYKLYDTAMPKFFIHAIGNAFQLMPYPNLTVTNAIRVQVSLRPTRTATSIPDTYADRFLDTWVAGTCAELARVPDSEFYNPKIYTMFEEKFQYGILQAKKEASGADRAVPRKVKYGGL